MCPSRQGGHCFPPLRSPLGMAFKAWGSLPPPPPKNPQSWQIFILPGRIWLLEGTQHHLDPSVVNQVEPQAQEYHFWSNTRLWRSDPRQIVWGGSETGPEVNSKAAARTALLEETYTYSPDRTLYPYTMWIARYKNVLSFLHSCTS